MEFYNQNKLNISKEIYERFLSELKKRLKNNEFEKSLIEVQNIFIVKVLNLISKELNFGEIIKLENLVKDKEICKMSKNYDMTVCFGNSNDYNRLNKLNGCF